MYVRACVCVMKYICKVWGWVCAKKKKKMIEKKKRVCNDRNGQWSNFLSFIRYI